MGSEHEPVRALSYAHVEQFIRDGFVRIDQAFPWELADEGRAMLERLPAQPSWLALRDS
jgi:hypothetical protein